METDSFELKQLCDIAGVTSRTVYFYIQQGLLPHAGTHGPGAKYERRHLARLQLVKLLQREHLPLAEIRERLQGLSDAQVEQAVAEASSAPLISNSSSADSALDYIRQLLSKDTSSPRVRQELLRTPRPAAGSSEPPVGSERSQWDRVVLTQDVELHIRRPLTRERNRQVERLLEEARRIMKEGGR